MSTEVVNEFDADYTGRHFLSVEDMSSDDVMRIIERGRNTVSICLRHNLLAWEIIRNAAGSAVLRAHFALNKKVPGSFGLKLKGLDECGHRGLNDRTANAGSCADGDRYAHMSKRPATCRHTNDAVSKRDERREFAGGTVDIPSNCRHCRIKSRIGAGECRSDKKVQRGERDQEGERRPLCHLFSMLKCRIWVHL